MYLGGTKLISLKLYRLADFYLDNVDGPKSRYINEAVDDLLHDHQTGHLDAQTLERCLAPRAWWTHRWWNRGEASRHTKLRIKRQNLEYMQLNMMNVNITINEAICRKAKKQGL